MPETKIIPKFEPIKCDCNPFTVTVCQMSEKEIQIKCRHGSVVTIKVIGEGKLMKI